MKRIMRKITKEDSEADFYIVSAECSADCISLTIIDNENAWTGKLELEEVAALCKSMNRKKEVYFCEVTTALEESKDFTFSIKNECFILKKIDSKTNIKIRFCSISLSKVPLLPTYTSLLGKLIKNEETNKHFISNMTKEISELKQERKDMMKKLQLLIEEKASLETTLYSQFCEVLNSKKQKITTLETQLSEITSAHQVHSQNQNVCAKKECKEGPVMTRSFMTSQVMEEDQTESNENLKTSTSKTVSETLGMRDKHSNHYDSDTDVDTEEEGGINDITCTTDSKTSSSSLNTFESKKRILPKRGNSSSSRNLKRKYPVVESVTSENKMPEFNSQSLLDEY